MRYLLNSLVQIALLRKDPSVLPASVLLVVLTGGAFAVASVVQSYILHGNDHLVGRTVLEIGLAIAVFWALLAATRFRNRLAQTLSAVFGTTVLVAPIIVALLTLRMPRILVEVISVLVILWYIVIIAHILRSAMQIGFVTSLAIAFTWLLVSDALVGWLFPPAPA